MKRKRWVWSVSFWHLTGLFTHLSSGPSNFSAIALRITDVTFSFTHALPYMCAMIYNANKNITELLADIRGQGKWLAHTQTTHSLQYLFFFFSIFTMVVCRRASLLPKYVMNVLKTDGSILYNWFLMYGQLTLGSPEWYQMITVDKVQGIMCST